MPLYFIIFSNDSIYAAGAVSEAQICNDKNNDAPICATTKTRRQRFVQRNRTHKRNLVYMASVETFLGWPLNMFYLTTVASKLMMHKLFESHRFARSYTGEHTYNTKHRHYTRLPITVLVIYAIPSIHTRTRTCKEMMRKPNFQQTYVIFSL